MNYKTPNSLMVDRAKFSFLLNGGSRKFMSLSYKDHLKHTVDVLYRHGYGYDHELISSVWIYNTTIPKKSVINLFTERVLNVQIDTNQQLPEVRKNKDAMIIMIAEKLAHVEYIISCSEKESFNNLNYYYSNIFKPKLFKEKECDELWKSFDKIMNKTWEQIACV